MKTYTDSHIFPFLWMRGESADLLREEIARIADCGADGLCLESRPHPDFLGADWWRDVDVVMEEAAARGLRVWVLDDAHFPTGYAGGAVRAHPACAKTYLAFSHADVTGPLRHADLDVGALMERAFTWHDLVEAHKPPLMQESRLLSVTAHRLAGGDAIEQSDIDLTEAVQDGRLRFDLAAGTWRIQLCYTTRDGDGDPMYINIIDRNAVKLLIDTVYAPFAERYQRVAGKTFAGFFSDEPSFGNASGFASDMAVGRRHMTLPWCEQMPAMLRASLGEAWRLLLPYLDTDCPDERLCARVRLAYMDALTGLYQQNFSEQVGAWCEARGLAYVGHVVEDNGAHSRLGCGAGHYFRAMAGQHMAGVDIIGGQLCVGGGTQLRYGFGTADGAFFHHALLPMGASAAMLDKKKHGRLMCELYGAYGWTTGVRDMKWITDFAFSRGVNRLVPHAFSMAAYPDDDCPPHFYARGHNAQFPHFMQLMRYADTLSTMFSGGVGGAQTAILYPAECDWMGACMPLEQPARALDRAQVDFWVLPEDALAEEALPKDVRIALLIVPQTRFLTLRAARAILARGEDAAVFVGALPTAIPDATAAEEAALLSALSTFAVLPLSALGGYCREAGLCAGVLTPAFAPMHVYRYCAEGAWRYMLFNESATEIFSGTAALSDGTVWTLTLRPYESAVMDGGRLVFAPVPACAPGARQEDISGGWTLALAAAGEDFGAPEPMAPLRPVSDSLPTFAGRMRYERILILDDTPENAVLEAEWLFETADLFVGDRLVCSRLTPPYRFAVSGVLQAGENRIRIEVYCPPARDALMRGHGPFSRPRSVLEPTGMFGRITLATWRS